MDGTKYIDEGEESKDALSWPINYLSELVLHLILSQFEMISMPIGAYRFWLARLGTKQNFKMAVTNRTLWDCY